jgi:hypothetical protein
MLTSQMIVCATKQMVATARPSLPMFSATIPSFTCRVPVSLVNHGQADCEYSTAPRQANLEGRVRTIRVKLREDLAPLRIPAHGCHEVACIAFHHRAPRQHEGLRLAVFADRYGLAREGRLVNFELVTFD